MTWYPIDIAPVWRAVKVTVGEGMEFVAILMPDASMNKKGESCDQCRAVYEGEHPPCWTDGACWALNADMFESLQPKEWREVIAEEVK